MPNRKTTATRRNALAEDLRKACRDGDLRPGDMLPTMRELQEKYGLSPRTVSMELKRLSDEGLLRTVPRAGIYVADPAGAADRVFLMITATRDMATWVPHTEQVRLGFEEQVTQLGGSTLVMNCEDADQHGRAGILPELAGVFVVSSDPRVDVASVAPPSVPRVRQIAEPTPVPDGAVVDTVHMDNVEGGRAATRHLFQHGHRRIAFLGLHTGDSEQSDTDVGMRWSALREEGWRDVMDRFGESTKAMVFQPDEPSKGWDDEVRLATETARPIVTRRDVTAVVCANDHAVLGLLTALRDADILPEAWPSVVGFDGLAEADRHVLTSMRLPWERIGRQAAELLTARALGKLTGPGRHHLVPMSLVSRMGPKPTWLSEDVERLIPTAPA